MFCKREQERRETSSSDLTRIKGDNEEDDKPRISKVSLPLRSFCFNVAAFTNYNKIHRNSTHLFHQQSRHGSIKAFPFQKLPKTTCGDQTHARFHSSDDRLQTITADHPLSPGGDWRVLQKQKVLQIFQRIG
jgi:hypothetical protein